VALSTGMAAAQACWAKCYAAHHSLAILSSDFKCRCGLQAPPTTTRLADTACNAGGAGMAVFHLHDGACQCALKLLAGATATAAAAVAASC
jgi:hypothetical protein